MANKEKAALAGAAQNHTSNSTSRREYTWKLTSTPAVSMDVLLSRLDGVRRTGDGTWSARCPAHDDRSASLSVRETDDGKKLLHCFAGCSVHEITSALGIELSDLFQPREPGRHSVKPERRPFPAADALRAIAFEALVVCAAARRIVAREPLPESDYERLLTAAEAINAALSATGAMRGTPWKK